MLIDVTVMPRRLPFVGLFMQPAIYRVAARLVDGEEESARQVVQGRIAAAALVGPWRFDGVAGLAVTGLVGLGLTGLLVLLALRGREPPGCPRRAARSAGRGPAGQYRPAAAGA